MQSVAERVDAIILYVDLFPEMQPENDNSFLQLLIVY